ncbi:MAG TPA: hypothetical protein VGR11_00020 [Solirubrobacteraceae bacterium]|nr:hypothetical protein [Solirubrobacteraceae bacterium]
MAITVKQVAERVGAPSRTVRYFANSHRCATGRSVAVWTTFPNR